MNPHLRPGGLLMPGAPRPKHHPIAALFPMLEEDKRASFRESLSHGQNHPVVMHKGLLLDGRNRERELVELGKPVGFIVFTGTDRQAFDFVMDENLERRHLNESQRAMLAAKAATLRLGDNQHRAQAAPIGAPSLFEPEAEQAEEPQVLISQSDAADKMSVGRRSVQRAVTVQEKGTAELQQAVVEGNIAVSAAAEIAERPAEEQKAILDSLPRDAAGKLTADAKKEIRKAAKEVRSEDTAEKKKKRAEREAKLGAKIAALPQKKYGVILTDDEHRFIPYSQETGMDRAADNHYPTSDVATLAARDLDSIAADDCVLGSWVTDLARGIDVMRARGFEFKSYFVWVKDIVEIELTETQRKTGLGGRVLMQIGSAGTGYWNRDRDELFLIGTRGKVVAPAMGEQGESVWFAARPPLEEGEVSKHSKKPPNAHEWFEQHYPNTPKIELNARRVRPGWDLWGNEAPEVEQPALELAREEAAA